MARKGLFHLPPPGSFIRNVGLLTGGTAFAQGLAVLALPFLTRLYTPEDFTLLSVYVAVIGIFTVMSSLRYNIAIPLPEQDTEGFALLGVALLFTIVISSLLTLFLLAFPNRSANLLGQPEMVTYLWMIPVGVFLGSSYNALQYWASRKKRFATITYTRITRAVGGIGAQLALGLSRSSPFGLIFGHMLYSGLGGISLLRSIAKHDRHLLQELTRPRFLEMAISYRRFPFWSVPESLFNAGGLHLPIIIIAAAAAGPEAGLLMLAMRFVSLPMGLVGSSVAQVFFAHAPEERRKGNLRRYTLKTIWTLFKLGLSPLAIAAALSPMLFPIVFGQEWARAGWLVVLMAPLSLLQFMTSPVSMVLHVVDQQKTAMVLQAFGLVLRVSAVVVAARFTPDLLVEAYIASGVILYIVYFLVIQVVLKLETTRNI